MYHAGLSDAQRQGAHQDFLFDRIDVLVATVAFGKC
jgi:superfamily II DNA helicase RecQ